MKTELTFDQAKAIITDPNHDPWGKVRMYGIIQDEPYTGQITAIKSVTHLNEFTYSSIYTVTNDGNYPPIRKA